MKEPKGNLFCPKCEYLGNELKRARELVEDLSGHINRTGMTMFVLDEAKAYLDQVPVDRSLSEEQELLLSCFRQACTKRNETGKVTYSHGWLSAYEHAQEYLIQNGIIKAEDCEIG